MRCRAEERLVLPDRLALVVVDLRARPHPARIGVRRMRVVEVERPGLRLDLGLRLPPEAVGIDEVQLNAGRVPGAEVADVGLARDRGRADRGLIEIVHDPAGRGPEMLHRQIARRIGFEIALDGARREAYEDRKAVPSTGPSALPITAVPASIPSAVEARLGAIAVGVNEGQRAAAARDNRWAWVSLPAASRVTGARLKTPP